MLQTAPAAEVNHMFMRELCMFSNHCGSVALKMQRFLVRIFELQ